MDSSAEANQLIHEFPSEWLNMDQYSWKPGTTEHSEATHRNMDQKECLDAESSRVSVQM